MSDGVTRRGSKRRSQRAPQIAASRSVTASSLYAVSRGRYMAHGSPSKMLDRSPSSQVASAVSTRARPPSSTAAISSEPVSASTASPARKDSTRKDR